MEFPINQELVKEATALKKERTQIRKRLEKIEQSRSEVSPRVYERVKGDYDAKLQEASQALLAKKDAVDRELATLYEARSKVTTNVEEHQEQFEEVKFRHSLGEFKETEFKKKSDEVGVKLQKFETLLAAINNNITTYEQLFADEPDLLPSGPAPAEVTPLPTPEVPVHEALKEAVEPSEPEPAYDLGGEGGDYFKPQQMSETAVFRPEDLESETMVGPEPTPTAGPILAVLKGESSGAVYPIHGSVTIGRGKSNAIVIREPKVSRQHADIRRKGKQWIVHDLQSSNGVLVNGARVNEAALESGDQLQIGDTVFEFRYEA